MTTPPDPIEPPRLRVFDATCLACGLLCDDIALSVDDGRIVEAENACERGRIWFLDEHRHPDRPSATIDGEEATLDAAIDRAAAILAGARAPLVTGLSGTTVESQAMAVALADRIGAAIDPGHSRDAWPRVSAVQRAGGAFASFGELKNRADVVMLWGVDPATDAPRFWERLVDPPGRFVPGGRSGRAVLVVDSGESDARSRADAALTVPDGRDAEVLRVLRALVLGIALDSDRVERTCGCTLEVLRGWADRLSGARYGVVAFLEQETEAIEALMRLLDDLNRTTRWVALPMARGGNPTGAEAVMTGRLGAPLAVDLSDGSPRFLPDDADHRTRLGAVDPGADAVLDVGGSSDRGMSPDSAPLIVLSPTATVGGGHRRGVAIACATPGIDSGGAVVRSDEVTIPLRPALDPIRPTDREVLAAILGRLGNSS